MGKSPHGLTSDEQSGSEAAVLPEVSRHGTQSYVPPGSQPRRSSRSSLNCVPRPGTLAPGAQPFVVDPAGTGEAGSGGSGILRVPASGRHLERRKVCSVLAARDGHLDVCVTEIGTNHYRNLTEGKFQQLRNPEIRTLAFSPDDSLVTFWARNGDGSQAQDVNVLAVPTMGGALQPYLPETAEFDWSPDGRRLVFHTTAPGDPLFLRTAGNATAHQIYVAAPGTHCHFLTWSPDGEFIYFVRGDPSSADWDIWRLRPSGAALERLTYHDSRVTYPVLLDARTLPLSGDRCRRLRAVVVCHGCGAEAHASGQRWLGALYLPCCERGRTRLVATVADFRSDLWRVSVRSGGPPANKAEQIAPVTPSASGPRFGSGYILYVSTGGARRGIWKYANGIATELWGDAGVDRVGAPTISPDGRRVAFTVERRGATQLYAIDNDGRNLKAVTRTVAFGVIPPGLPIRSHSWGRSRIMANRVSQGSFSMPPHRSRSCRTIR